MFRVQDAPQGEDDPDFSDPTFRNQCDSSSSRVQDDPRYLA